MTTVLNAYLLFGLFMCPVNSWLHSPIRYIPDYPGVVLYQPSLALSKNSCLGDIIDPQM